MIIFNFYPQGIFTISELLMEQFALIIPVFVLLLFWCFKRFGEERMERKLQALRPPSWSNLNKVIFFVNLTEAMIVAHSERPGEKACSSSGFWLVKTSNKGALRLRNPVICMSVLLRVPRWQIAGMISEKLYTKKVPPFGELIRKRHSFGLLLLFSL